MDAEESVPHLSVRVPEPMAENTARSLLTVAALGENTMVKVDEAATLLTLNLYLEEAVS